MPTLTKFCPFSPRARILALLHSKTNAKNQNAWFVFCALRCSSASLFASAFEQCAARTNSEQSERTNND